MTNKTPLYLHDRLPPKHKPFLFNVFRNIKCRTDRCMNSFFPNAVASWNTIIYNFEDFPSFDSLKEHMLSLFRPKIKSIFGVHDPLALQHLFQLRVSLSPLRSHKNRHNFIDTPSDICHCKQGSEDSNHFLFSCPSYITERETLEISVKEILLRNNLIHLENQSQLYLYGYHSLSYADNMLILIATLKFIKDTRRFST